MQPPSHDDTQTPLQFSNQPPQYQQLQPHMMLCPVQFVYEPQIMVPPDEQVVPPAQTPTFQNQGFLLNVQNTPPWIQNRSNMVYMPQMQMGNMQPFIQQHMVQNPMYNYQYQPMIMHDQIRQIMPYMNHMQSPQMVQNVVQNSQSIAQNVIQNQSSVPNSPSLISTQNLIQSPMRLQMEQKRESSMLSHILHNNMTKQAIATPSQHAEFASPMQIIRPHFQNTRPQMIIVNPIGPTHTCTHKQKDASGVTFEKPRTEVPMQIRKQIPDGLSVKTVFKLSTTALVRPNDYVQNIAPVDEAHPRVYPKPVVKPVSNRDPQTNYKRKIREILELNTKDESEAQLLKRNCLVSKKEMTNNAVNSGMPLVNGIEAPNINSGIVGERSPNEQNGTNRVQLNDKLLRNTVYVQARGIVNEMPKVETQNASTSMASHQNTTSITKLRHGVSIENEMESRDSLPDVSVNISIVENSGENVEDNSSQKDSIVPETVIVNGYAAMAQNDLTITQCLPINEANIVINNNLIMTIPANDAEVNSLQITRDSSKSTMLSNTESDDAKLRKILKMARFRQPDDQINTDKTVTPNCSKTTTLTNNNESDDTKNLRLPKVNQFLHSDDAGGIMTRNNSKMTKILQSSNADNKVKTQREPKTKSKEVRTAQEEESESERATTSATTQNDSTAVGFRKDPKVFLLTHVVEGHIIQESNVPFTVQQPIVTRRNTNPIVIHDVRPSTSRQTEPSTSRLTEPSTSRQTEPSVSRQTEPSSSRQTEPSTSRQAEPSTSSQTEPSTSSQTEPSTSRQTKSSTSRQAEPSTSKQTKPSSSRQNEPSTSNSEANELRTNHVNIEPVDTETSDEEMELAINYTATEESAQPHTKNEVEAEPELAGTVSGIVERNEEDPFEILSLGAVKLWTVSDLASHLMDHENWQDTAQKLREEEIDGESLLLVNKEQLIQIGISEEHADVLSAFLERE